MFKRLESGVMLIDKHAGITSHDAVNRIRKVTGIRRIGHCGTLDPLATGLLVICVGRYTRLSPWLTCADKEYVSTFEFGSQSNTDDADGTITKLCDISPIEKNFLQDTLKSFRGSIMQIPPIYSAIRVGGQRSYKNARSGKNIKLLPRPVLIDKIDLINYSYPEATFNIRCSKGTYIRSLARDLGKACGSAGYVRKLRRVKIGSIDIKRSLTVAEVEKRCNKGDLNSCYTSLSDVLVDLPHLFIEDQPLLVKRFINGNPIECSSENDEKEHAVFDEKKRLLGIGRISSGKLHPNSVMATQF